MFLVNVIEPFEVWTVGRIKQAGFNLIWRCQLGNCNGYFSTIFTIHWETFVAAQVWLAVLTFKVGDHRSHRASQWATNTYSANDSKLRKVAEEQTLCFWNVSSGHWDGRSRIWCSLAVVQVHMWHFAVRRALPENITVLSSTTCSKPLKALIYLRNCNWW